MIRLVTGVPGSGKSYFAVYEIVKLYYSVDSTNFYKLKNKKTLLLHNVDTLKLDGAVDLDYYLRSNNLTINQLLTVDYIRSLKKKYDKIVIFLDEAQRFFPRRFSDDNVFYFFQYHRHLGVNIYLITQDIKLLPVSIVALAEFEIRSVRRSLRFSSSFVYYFYSSGESISRKALPVDKRIFALYKSFDSDDTGGARQINALRRYLIIFVFFLVAVLGGAVLFVHTFFHHPGKSVLASRSVPAPASHSIFTSTSVSVPRLSSSVKSVSFSPASLGHDPFVLVRIGSFPGSGSVTSGNTTYFIVFGRVFRRSELPYPLVVSKSGYYLRVPSNLVTATYRDYYYDMQAKAALRSSFDSSSSSPAQLAGGPRPRAPLQASGRTLAPIDSMPKRNL